jgi:hypothetical protein
MCEDSVQISHGGSQGFKSPHLHPQEPQVRAPSASSGRRSLHVAAAARPQAQVAAQPRRLAATRRVGPRPHAMTTQRGRYSLRTPARLPTGRSSRASGLSWSATGRPSHCPTTCRDDDGQVQADASAGPARLRQPRPSGSDPGRRRAGRDADPAPPAMRLLARRRPPRPHSGRTQRTRERTDTGRPHWTPRRPHRTLDTGRVDTGRSHRTLDAGRWPRTPTR